MKMPRTPLLAPAALATLAWTGSALAQAVKTTVQVAMPDGVTLATDVWRSAIDPATHATLLRRTPYGRAALDSGFVNAAVGAGYVLVSQDVRGRGDSGGTFLPFLNDAVDGPTTMAWIAAQPWSNGKVGSYSASAEGIVQFMAMKGAPPQLRCAQPVMPTHDVYETLFPGGVWRTDLGTDWLTDLNAAGVIGQLKAHEVRDGYWDAGTLSTTEMASVDYPVFVVGGLFDIFGPTEVRAFAELQANAAQASRGDAVLFLGPWTHGGMSTNVQGQLVFPADAAYAAFANDFVAYYGWCLNGGPRPSLPHVRSYVVEVTDGAPDAGSIDAGVPAIAATGEWRTGDTWPPPESRPFSLYLEPDDSLGGAAPPASAASVAIPVDPANPVPSVGGANLSTAAGPYDQQVVDARPDVHVFTTAPVTATTEIIGRPRALVWASSATTDVDVVVRLEDVTPGGKAVAMTDGARRGRFVQGFDAVRPMVPGQPALFEVDMGPVSLRLPAGHRLRFAFSGTSSPHFEPGPNVAQPLASSPTPVATTLTLLRDGAHASRVELPVAAGAVPGAFEVTSDGGADEAGTVAPSEDASSGSGTTGLDGGTGEGASPGAPSGSSGCGCRMAGAPGMGGGGAVVGFLALAVRRRRTKRR
jgi:MYXO-CTERM domain-containing protein